MIFLLNQRYVNMYVLDVLSSFNYVEISMMHEWKVLNWFEVCCSWDLIMQRRMMKFHVDWFMVFEESMICKE
jgi:hypothetical protein